MNTGWVVPYAVFYIALSVVTGLVVRAFPVPILGATQFTQDATYALGFKFLGLLVVPLVMMRRHGVTVAQVAQDWRPTPVRMVWLVLAFALGFCLNLGHLDRIAPVYAQSTTAFLWPRLTLAVVLPLFTAGLPEELFYRGLLQTHLTQRHGAVLGVLTTSVAFTAWHLPTRFLLAHGVEGQAGNALSVLVGTGIPVFMVSLVFGWLWHRHRSLPALVCAHWGIDVLPAASSLLGIVF